MWPAGFHRPPGSTPHTKWRTFVRHFLVLLAIGNIFTLLFSKIRTKNTLLFICQSPAQCYTRQIERCSLLLNSLRALFPEVAKSLQLPLISRDGCLTLLKNQTPSDTEKSHWETKRRCWFRFESFYHSFFLQCWNEEDNRLTWVNVCGIVEKYGILVGGSWHWD